MKLYLCILSAFASSIIFSQSAKPSIAKEPVWITKNTIDYTNIFLDKEATDGYVDMAYETQVSLADQTEYVRRSKKIISQAGIQNGSEVSVNFDPSYQQLFFNTIRIIRGAEVLNKLQLSAIKTIHQEKELNNFIYNGTLNALLILDDVRQGDIIEYSYTLKGFNPVFKNKYTEALSLQYSIPIYNLYHKLIVPAGRKIHIKNLNNSLQPTIDTVNGQQIYEWRKNNASSLAIQDFTPGWYNPFAQVLISEFNNWKEVNDWAMALFPVKKNLSPALQKKINEIEAAHTTVEDRTQAALRFVQDDIRYMGIEMGENSHKPADPSQVFTQRFGDCKEKSYLLCMMLNTMGIPANVVLINTDNKKVIETWLPAPTDFDHATIRVKIGSEYFYFDPTIAYQRGNIKSIFYPDYQVGLVIADSTAALTSIPFRNVSSQHIQELFTVAYMYGSGTLLVTTTYKGCDADRIRSDYNTESNTDLMTNYQKFYAGYYDEIKADSITHVDDEHTGTFTTNEFYTLPQFWKGDASDPKKFTISSFMIDAGIRRPKEKKRNMPFRLLYPSKTEEEIIVDLPSDWTVTASETHLKNDGFTYNSRFYCQSNRVHLSTDYENLKDNVTADEASKYFEDLKKFDDGGSFTISYGNVDAANGPSKPTSKEDIILVILVLIIIIGGFIWWSQHITR